MVSHPHIKPKKLKSLNAQIKHCEQQVLNSKRALDSCANMLAGNIRQQITTPTTLLLAGGIGFIFGEVTRRQARDKKDTVDNKPHAKEKSPLTAAFDLMMSTHTLYSALPLTWLIESFKQAQTATPAANTHLQPENPHPAPSVLDESTGGDA